MPIDSFTVLLFGLFIKLVLGVLFLLFWLQKHRLLVRLVERVAANWQSHVGPLHVAGPGQLAECGRRQPRPHRLLCLLLVAGTW
jgi:hypothetical protein